ncbi:hypothetical protein ACFSRY_09860 [Pontibacter locisalis]|uniref:Uncharacterized protein n=1 Tax=Pontibacter locisalis TaxID=1719035 RepID=A0ABW5IKV4_9BACT
MKLFSKLIGSLALMSAFTLTSCEKQEINLSVVPVNGMTVTLTPQAGGDSQSFTMSTTVMDNAGREHGTFKREDIILQANTTYDATITFFSDKGGVRQEQNEAIKREEAYYTVKYFANSNSTSTIEVDVSVIDKKADGTPLGFKTKFKTDAAGMDAINVELFVAKSKGNSSMNGTVFNATYWIDVQN